MSNSHAHPPPTHTHIHPYRNSDYIVSSWKKNQARQKLYAGVSWGGGCYLKNLWVKIFFFVVIWMYFLRWIQMKYVNEKLISYCFSKVEKFQPVTCTRHRMPGGHSHIRMYAIYKFVAQWPHLFYFFDKNITSLFKKYKFFHKFQCKYVTKHILFGIWSPKDPSFFVWNLTFHPRTPLFWYFFQSPNAPYSENWGCIPVSVLYISAPWDRMEIINSYIYSYIYMNCDDYIYLNCYSYIYMLKLLWAY